MAAKRKHFTNIQCSTSTDAINEIIKFWLWHGDNKNVTLKIEMVELRPFVNIGLQQPGCNVQKEIFPEANLE